MRLLVAACLLVILVGACGGSGTRLKGTVEECERLSTGKLDASSCVPMFRAVDTDQNGIIEQAECRRFVESLDFPPTTPREYDQPIGCDHFPK
jgi:hypothetical protein